MAARLSLSSALELMGASITRGGSELVGTNGAIECCVATLASQAAKLFGPQDPMSVFFASQRDGFFPGMWVNLDDVQCTKAQLRRLVELFGEALQEMEGQADWTEKGREWLKVEVRRFISEMASER